MNQNPYESPVIPSDAPMTKLRASGAAYVLLTLLVGTGSVTGFFLGLAQETHHEGITLIVGGLIGGAVYRFVSRATLGCFRTTPPAPSNEPR